MKYDVMIFSEDAQLLSESSESKWDLLRAVVRWLEESEQNKAAEINDYIWDELAAIGNVNPVDTETLRQILANA